MNVPKLLSEYVEENGSVGVSLALIENGKITFFNYGKQSIYREDPISEDSIFEIGSITKVFTTLALVDLVSKGEVSLDDPIEIYLPGVQIPEFEEKKITLRHLATHTSGIPRMPEPFEPKNPDNPYQDYNFKELSDFLSHLKLTRAPGELVEYSNVGMGLLGHILCEKTGKSYEELIQGLVAEELNMPSTFMTPQAPSFFVTGHHLKQPVGHWDFSALAGAGAIRSNIKDMATFLATNMGFTHSPIHRLLQQCHQKQIEPMPGLAVGLGWMDIQFPYLAQWRNRRLQKLSWIQPQCSKGSCDSLQFHRRLAR